MSTWFDWFVIALSQYPSPAAYYADWCAYHAPLYDAIMRASPPPGRLVEVGAGIGLSARAMAERGYAVVALERDPLVLSLGQALSCPGPHLIWVQGDEEDILHESDVVTCLGIVEHLDRTDRARLLRTLVALAPIQAVAIPSPLGLEVGSRGLPPMGEQPIPLEQLVAECEAAGMQIMEAFGWGTVPDRDGHLSFAVIGRRA